MKTSSLSTSPGLHKRQAGYTLIELSISLAIIAVLLVGTLTGVQRLLGANNANNTISQTQAALTNITKLFAASADAGIYAEAELAKMGVWEKSALLPTANSSAPTGAKSPFGGAIQVDANTFAFSGVLANTGFWYRLTGIPVESCASVATSFVNTADAIYVTSTTPTDGSATPGTAGAYKAGPTAALSTTALSSGCSSTTTTVTISLYIPS